MGRYFRGPDKDATITRQQFLLDDARREIAALRVELAHKDEEHAAALKRIHAEATETIDRYRSANEESAEMYRQLGVGYDDLEERLRKSNEYIAKLEAVLRKHGIIQ
jgi:predicted extracellular nuclease